MTPRRRLLMIAYYFPPFGMGGVQRPLKFAKYLPQHGWDVDVITAAPHNYYATDETLLDELTPGIDVHRVNVFDPARVLKRSTGSKSNDSLSVRASKLKQRIREFGRIPDAKLHFARAAKREALRLASSRRFDAVYTTSPPPSIHSAGLRVRERLQLPWVADFRDPWLVHANDWGPTGLHRRYARNLRARILGTADHVIAMNEIVADEFRHTANPKHLSVIPNGYDEDDFTGAPIGNDRQELVLVFYGTASPDTDYRPILEAVDAANSLADGPPIRVEHIGETVGLPDCDHPALKTVGYLPHRDAIRRMCAADAVVVSLGSDSSLHLTIPGRTYEVLRSLRPIIVFAPADSELMTQMVGVPGVWCCDPADRDCGLNAIREIRALDPHRPARDVESLGDLSRQAQTARLAEILDALVADSPMREGRQ